MNVNVLGHAQLDILNAGETYFEQLITATFSSHSCMYIDMHSVGGWDPGSKSHLRCPHV